MLSDFHSVLCELEQPDSPLTPGQLSKLSGPTRSDADAFVLFLERIGLERKRDLITKMVRYAEERFEIDYMDLFRHCMRDSDPLIRRQAIEGLWEDRRPDLVKSLLEIFTSDEDTSVRAAAATALGKFLFLAECDELDGQIGTMIERALQSVIAGEKDIEVTRRAVESIAYINDDSVRRIIDQAYSHHDARMRESGVFAMGRSADRFWAETVLAELYADLPAMRYEAARACGELQLERAIGPLDKLVGDPDVDIRSMAIWALGQIGGKHARAIPDRCVESENELLSTAAAEALAEMEFADRSMDLMVYGPDDTQFVEVDLDPESDQDDFLGNANDHDVDADEWRDDFIELN